MIELRVSFIGRKETYVSMFQHQVNAAIPDEHISVTAVSFEGGDIIEADMVMNATQTGEIFGIPPAGRKIRFDVH